MMSLNDLLYEQTGFRTSADTLKLSVPRQAAVASVQLLEGRTGKLDAFCRTFFSAKLLLAWLP